MVGYLAFLRYEDSETFLRPGLTNAILVKVMPDSDPKTVHEAISQRFPEVNVQTSDQIVEAYREEVVGSFIPILLVARSSHSAEKPAVNYVFMKCYPRHRSLIGQSQFLV